MQADPPLSHHAPLCTKRPAKSYKSFPVHEQIECAICDNWITPERIFIAPKITERYPVEKEFITKWAIPVVDPALSVLNKHLTGPIEDVPYFKDSADRKFVTLLKAVFAPVGLVLLQPLAAITVCQTAANCTRATNMTLYVQIVLF